MRWASKPMPVLGSFTGDLENSLLRFTCDVLGEQEVNGGGDLESHRVAGDRQNRVPCVFHDGSIVGGVERLGEKRLVGGAEGS